MSRYPQSLQEVFDAYGRDAAGGLEAWANADSEKYWPYVESAAERRYLADYDSWRRSLTQTVEKEMEAEGAGQARLFEPVDGVESVVIRSRFVFEGQEYGLPDMVGFEGAQLARKIAERDLAPALTTVNRSRFLLQVADHVERETERLGRPVSFAEVLRFAA